MTNRHQRGIGSRPASDRSGDETEHLSEAIHQDSEQNTHSHVVRTAIQDGLSSGLSDKTLRDIWAEAERRYLARNG